MSTKIEWTEKTWNPVTGCTRASAGCDNCYAVGMTRRLAAMGQEKYKGLVNEGKKHFNGVVKCHPDALTIPLQWKRPRNIFVNSMSDLFHKDVPFEFIDKVFAVMALAPRHTFQVLTKRPERMAEYMKEGRRSYVWNEKCSYGKPVLPMRWPLPNVWLGTSVENQEAADERIPHLLRTPAAVRWLSMEPLLGPVDLDKFGWGDTGKPPMRGCLYRRRCSACGMIPPSSDVYCDNCGHGATADMPSIDWVVAGCESGHGARPTHPDCVRSIRDQCAAAGVPFFFKQWGAWAPWHEDVKGATSGKYQLGAFFQEGFSTCTVIEALGRTAMIRMGKGASGRLLDGKEHNEYPTKP